MSQVLASTRMPVPNVLPGFIGDYGTLFIHTGNTWHVWTGLEWQPDKKGYTAVQLWRAHKVRPPTNLPDGWAGICHGGPHAINWTARDLRSAMKEFMRRHADEYLVPDGQCWDPLKKGRMLKRQEIQRAADDLRRHAVANGLIVQAPADLVAHARVY